MDSEHLAWCIIDGVAIFLDVAGDRYFRLAPDRNRRFVDEHGTSAERPVQPDRFPRPEMWQPPRRQSEAVHDRSFNLTDVARSIWTQRRVERQLAAQPLSAVLAACQHTLYSTGYVPDALSAPQRREVCAFERAKLLRSAADRCLPRSLALALCLARRACRAQIVFGVKLAPFGAHCWTQAGDEVLNDEVEEVLRYTPILVL